MNITINSPSSDPITGANFVSASFTYYSATPEARIYIQFVRQSGTLDAIKEIVVNDGATPDQLWLTGNGQAPQPVGLLMAMGTTPANETGTIPARWARRILTWLSNNTQNLQGMTVL